MQFHEKKILIYLISRVFLPGLFFNFLATVILKVVLLPTILTCLQHIVVVQRGYGGGAGYHSLIFRAIKLALTQ